MQITQRDAANSLRTPTVWKQRDASNTLRTLQQIWMRDSTNTLRQIYSATGGGGGTAQLSPDVYGYGYSSKPIFVTTDTAAVNSPPAGATFVWNFADAGWSAVYPTQSFTGFRKLVAAGASAFTSVTCTVTVGGSSYTTNAITAAVENQG